MPVVSETFERQYNPRLAVPDYQRWFSGWREESTHARETLLARLDLPFDASPSGTMDYFSANSGTRSNPCLIFIHGGYWRSMDKSDFSFIAPPWVGRGVHVVIPNYMLCPQATLGDIVSQIRRFYRRLLDQADTLGIDPNHVMMVGHSAGAHLAAMILAEPTLPAPRVTVGLSGIYDLVPLLQTSINNDLALDTSTATALSPQHMPRPAKDCRLRLYTGELEPSAFHQQRMDFGRAWAAERNSALPGLHHFSILDVLKNPEAELFQNGLNGSGA